MRIAGQSILATVNPQMIRDGKDPVVFQGLNQASTDMILLGALPTIFLAVLAGLTLDLAVEATGGTARGPA